MKENNEIEELLLKYPELREFFNIEEDYIEEDYIEEDYSETIPFTYSFGDNRDVPKDIDYSLVKHIGMGKSGIATKEQPLIATDSLATCTGILAYDLDNNFTFLAHSTAVLSFLYARGDRLGCPSISKHVMDLKNICNNDGRYLNLTVEVLPGIDPDSKAIDTIKNNLLRLASSPTNKFRIVSINEVDSFGGSILFDSRTGKRCAYDKRQNPFYVPDDSIDKQLGTLVDAFTSNRKNSRWLKKLSNDSFFFA